MKNVYGLLGDSIRARRLKLGLTLEDLAELASMHASYIGQIERNSKKASLKTVASLAVALGVPVSRLFADGAIDRGALFPEQLDVILRATSGRERKLILGVLRQLAKGLKNLS